MNRPAPLAIKFKHCCQDIKQAMQLIYIRLDKNGLRFMGNGLQIKYCPFCGKEIKIERREYARRIKRAKLITRPLWIKYQEGYVGFLGR